MFYLTGTAATSALDLIATLQQTLGTNNSGSPSTATTFDPGTTTSGTASNTPSDANAPTSLLAPDTLDALLAVQGQGPIVNGDAFSQQLFSLLDTNGDGSISKSEFEAAFGQNGNTTQADQIFAELDTNGGGSISQTELTNAIDGQDQLQRQGAQQVYHHHHHHGGFGAVAASMGGGADAASSSGSDSSGGATDPLAALGGTSQSVTNSDGSTTTTITYSDGSQVSMTMPAANSSSSGSGGSSSSRSGGLGNYLEQMIARQAQMLANLGAAAGQSLAITA